MDFAIGKIDRDLIEFPEHVHAHQQGRLVGQAKAFKRRRIGESNQQVSEAGTTDTKFA